MCEKVFSDPAARKKLEEFIHPKVKDEILKIFEQNLNVVFISIPLLFETGFDALFDKNDKREKLKKGFEDFFKSQDADIFCLQETKMQIIEGQETKEIQEILNLPIFNNYHCYWNSAEKKGYSGTAIFTKQEPISVKYGIDIPEHDKEGRVITLEFDKFYMVDIYTPNSKRELERLRI